MSGNARRRPFVLAAAGALVLVGLAVAWLGQRAEAAASAKPSVVWALSPASNTVTVRLTAGSGPAARQVLARSRLRVAETGPKDPDKSPAGAGKVRVRVPPGRRTELVVQVSGPQPFQQALTVTVPPRLRILAVRRGPHGVLVSASSPLRSRAGELLCGTDKVSFPARTQAAVTKSPERCRGRLRLTARDGERAVVRVSVPPCRRYRSTRSPARRGGRSTSPWMTGGPPAPRC